MPLLAKRANRLTSFFIYVIFAMIVLIFGFKAINYSIDFSFYTHYLLKWETALTGIVARDVMLPNFSGKNHIEYMDNIVKLMQKIPMEVPKSNTDCPYLYQISEKGLSKRQDIFLLCFEKKIILYGLSETTFNMLDKNIDGKLGRNGGKFKGKLQKDNEHYACIWQF